MFLWEIYTFMQTLLKSLVNGIPEYLDNGDMVRKTPTATMLRAARELGNLININNVNNEVIYSLQLRVDSQLKEIVCLQELLNDANKRNTELNANLQNLRNDSKQEGPELNIEVGCTSEQPSGSDSDGEGRGTN